MKKIFFILVSISLILSGTLSAKTLPNNTPIEDLQIFDVPNDDGGGLALNWKPFPKEKRIIEYRIYRGASPDSLFIIASIPVNPKTGVSADTMRFNNEGYGLFVTATSRGKLKHARGQTKGDIGGRILYRSFPRDMKTYGPFMDDYRILAVTNPEDYLLKSVMKEFTETEELEDGTIDTTSTILAGLKLEQFKYILNKLKADKEYYYAVQAVNNSRKCSPLSEIVSCIPIDNPPEKLENFYAVNYKESNEMRFEWSLPFFTTDIRSYNIYLIDENDKKHLIFKRASAYPYTSQTNALVSYEEIKEKFEKFNSANMEWYKFNISIKDGAGQETFALDNPIVPEFTTPDILPTAPEYFTVDDNPSDKGDKLRVYFGKPFVGISQLQYNDKRTKLRVNYFYKENPLFLVQRLFFTVDGVTKSEFVLNKKIDFKVDPNNLPNKISIRFDCKNVGVELPENHSISYAFNYDEKNNEINLVTDENISKYYYQVYKMSSGGGGSDADVWRYSKKLPYIEREYLDKIDTKESTFRGIPKYDLETNRLYTNTYFDICTWEDERPFYTNALYLDQLKQNNEELAEEIAKLNKELNEATTEEEKEELTEKITQYTKMLNEKPPVVKEANLQQTDKARNKILLKAHTNTIRSFRYFIRKTDGKGHFVDTEIFNLDGNEYIKPYPNWFKRNETLTLIVMLIFGALVFYMVKKARRGDRLYIRPISGIEEIDNALGRATEMGKPILFVPGLSGISDVATLAGLAILGKVAKKAAEFDTPILVPVRDYIVLPIAQEIVKEAHYEAGRPDTYDKNSVFFITTAQFAFVSGVNGIMIREQTATNFYMGMFFAESLLMTETGNMTGAIQIAGTDAITQLPFFITTCDYTLIGEELYAASAYLSRQPLILGTLKAQDYMKFLIVVSVLLGTFLSTLHLPFFMKWFPAK